MTDLQIIEQGKILDGLKDGFYWFRRLNGSEREWQVGRYYPQLKRMVSTYGFVIDHPFFEIDVNEIKR